MFRKMSPAAAPAFQHGRLSHRWQGSISRNPSTVTGKLTLGVTKYLGLHSFTVDNGGPERPEEWQGLSGTAFFSIESRALVAIASEVRPTAGNIGLRVTLLADALGTDFVDFWAASGLAHPTRHASATALSTYLDPRSVFDRLDLEHFVGRRWLLAELTRSLQITTADISSWRPTPVLGRPRFWHGWSAIGTIFIILRSLLPDLKASIGRFAALRPRSFTHTILMSVRA